MPYFCLEGRGGQNEEKFFTSLLIMLMMVIGQIFPVSALSYDEKFCISKKLLLTEDKS